MAWLMFENKGVASVDLLTIVGASTARQDASLIGMFGTGFKYAVAALLRAKLAVLVYCGVNGFKFGISTRTTHDVNGNEVTINEIVLTQISGKGRATRNLGMDVGFGEVDWKDIRMAVREFASNGYDASMSIKGDLSAFRMGLSDDARAKDGFTRIFVEESPEILEYYANRRKYLLWMGDVDTSKSCTLPKDSLEAPLRVYRKGVLVGEFECHSLFNYNLNDVSINEARVVTIGNAACDVSFLIRDANPSIIETYLRAYAEDKDVFEVTKVSSWGLRQSSWEQENESQTYNRRRQSWATAISNILGDHTVYADSHEGAAAAQRKGYRAISVKSEMFGIVKSWGARTVYDIVDQFEAEGYIKAPLTVAQDDLCAQVWDVLEEIHVTKGKDRPKVEGFYHVMDAGSTLKGYYDRKRETVGLSKDTLDTGLGFDLIFTLIEEYGHYITGASDETRDFQDWAFRVAARFISERVGVTV
jgi:hypothetical protein